MIEKCFALGFNYHNTDVHERSAVALTREKAEELYKQAKKSGIQALAILNTCNRMELYGVGDAETMEAVHLAYSGISPSLLHKMIRRKGLDAVRHIYAVVSGLDSQIIGDLQILGQFKTAAKEARHFGMANGYFQRLMDSCVQAAKEVKTNTTISGGTASLSYAVIKILKDIHPNLNANILSIGTGKFGINLIQNLKSYFPASQITVANRTDSKAIATAEKVKCNYLPFEEALSRIGQFDIVTSAVNRVGDYLIRAEMLNERRKQIFFDMSIPLTIDPQIQSADRQVITIDDASDMVFQAIEERKSQQPKAYEIIEKHLSDFLKWADLYSKSDYIKSWKTTVMDFSNQCPFIQSIGEDDRERVLSKRMSEFIAFIKNRNSLDQDPQRVIDDFIVYHRNVLKEEQQGVSKNESA